MSQAQANAWEKVWCRIKQHSPDFALSSSTGLECVLKWIDEHAEIKDGLTSNKYYTENQQLKQEKKELEQKQEELRQALVWAKRDLQDLQNGLRAVLDRYPTRE